MNGYCVTTEFVISKANIWLQSFLPGRNQQVEVNGFASSCLPVVSMVPQGTILGPTLFLMFINNLPTNITSSIKLFPDDCVLYHPINSVGNHFALQGNLDLDKCMGLNMADEIICSYTMFCDVHYFEEFSSQI